MFKSKLTLTLSTFMASFLYLGVTTATAQMYIEGQLSSVKAKDISTPVYSGSGGGLTFSNFKASISYDRSTSFGFELGYRISPGIRVGFGYSSFSLDWNAINGSGTISDGSSTINLSTTVRRSQISGASTLDNKVKTYMFNGYWDLLENPDSSFIPYLGYGFGQTNMSNVAKNSNTLAMMIGANYNLSENSYVGAKFTRYIVKGPTDKAGVKYQDIEADAISVTYGFRF